VNEQVVGADLNAAGERAIRETIQDRADAEWR